MCLKVSAESSMVPQRQILPISSVLHLAMTSNYLDKRTDTGVDRDCSRQIVRNSHWYSIFGKAIGLLHSTNRGVPSD